MVVTRKKAKTALAASTRAESSPDPVPPPVLRSPQLVNVTRRQCRPVEDVQVVPPAADIGRPLFEHGDSPRGVPIRRMPVQPVDISPELLIHHPEAIPAPPKPSVVPVTENQPSSLTVFSFILPKEQKDAVHKYLEGKGLRPNDVDLRQFIELICDKLEVTENELAAFKKSHADQQKEVQRMRKLIGTQKKLLAEEKQPSQIGCKACGSKPISRTFFCGHAVCEDCSTSLPSCMECQARTGGIALILHL